VKKQRFLVAHPDATWRRCASRVHFLGAPVTRAALVVVVVVVVVSLAGGGAVVVAVRECGCGSHTVPVGWKRTTPQRINVPVTGRRRISVRDRLKRRTSPHCAVVGVRVSGEVRVGEGVEGEEVEGKVEVDKVRVEAGVGVGVGEDVGGYEGVG
jgi:hypothetical protein